MNSEAWLARLNPEQQKAARHNSGPALVVAGPGSGKTRVLSVSIQQLLRQEHIRPQAIFAITFTHKAAQEIIERLQELPLSPPLPFVGTFHQFGLRILTAAPALIDRGVDFIIIDEEEKKAILRRDCGRRAADIAQITEEISREKQRLAMQAAAKEPPSPVVSDYETILRSRNALDFDDLLCLPLRLLREHPCLRQHWQQQISWLLIDEFQDSNALQFALIQLLMPPPQANIIAIGDPHQAIYGFRGADAAMINAYTTAYAPLRVYTLTTSYRCTQTILNAAAHVLQTTPLQGLSAGTPITVSQHPDERAEAVWVARTIQKLLGGTNFHAIDSNISDGNATAAHIGPGDIAVLCRCRAQFAALEHTLSAYGIPARGYSAERMFTSPLHQRLLELLRCGESPSGCPEDTTTTTLLNAIRRQEPNLKAQPLPEQLRRLAFALGEKHNKDIDELATAAAPFGTDRAAFLRAVSVCTDLDQRQCHNHTVCLLTLHAAKGLEFYAVFIVGCEDGLLPYSLFENHISDNAEEKRLFYVGLTRAKQQLYLSRALSRRLFGKHHTLAASPFLSLITPELTVYANPSAPVRRKKQKQRELF